jgi:hypothetical protein
MDFKETARTFGLVTILTCLLYWTGRWYKQWYFHEFGIPQETIDFDQPYYIFHSWCAVLVTVGIAGILGNLALPFISLKVIGTRSGWLWLWAILGVVGSLALVILLLSINEAPPARNSPSFLWKLRHSKDLIIITAGICSFASVAFFSWKNPPASKWNGWSLPSSAVGFILLTLLAWTAFASVGYWLGGYHARELKARVKMGSPTIRLKTPKDNTAPNRWVFVMRASDKRNFVYNVADDTLRCVPDEEIVDFQRNGAPPAL